MTTRHEVSPEFLKMIRGYGLTTAEIIYQKPDAPRSVIVEQTYVWQNYDLCPKFPALLDFLDFWQRELHGPLLRVQVAHSSLIKPAEIRAVAGVFRLH